MSDKDGNKKKEGEQKGEDVKSEAAAPKKSEAYARTWPELADRLLRGEASGVKKVLLATFGGGAALAFVGQRDLRQWSGALMREGQLQIERPVNWTTNHVQGCLRSLLYAGIVNVAFVIPTALFVGARVHDFGLKMILETILAIVFLAALAGPYLFWAPYLIRAGLIGGTFKGVAPEEGKSFAEGGVFDMLFGAVPDALQGVQDALRAPLDMMAAPVTFILVTFYALALFPWANRPELVYTVPFVGLMFSLFHGMWQPKNRRFEWHYLHSAFLYIIGALILLSVNPLVLIWETQPMDNLWGIVRMVVNTIIVYICHKMIHANATKSYNANMTSKTDATTKPAAPVKAVVPAVTAQIDGKFWLGLTAMLAVGAIITFAFLLLREGARGGHNLSDELARHNFFQSGQFATPTQIHGFDGGGVAQAATVTSERIDSTLVWTATVKAQSGSIPTDPPIPMVSGAMYEVTVLEGTYTFDNATLTTSGTWNGKAIVPNEHPQALGEYLRDMVNKDDPVGLLYVMPGLRTRECPVINDHSAFTVAQYSAATMAPALFNDKDHMLYLKLNVPQNAAYNSHMTGTLKIRVRRMN